MLWWKSLPEVDKANVGNVTELINGCESVIGSERQAWLATTVMSSKELAKAAGKDEDDEEGNGTV